MHALDQEEKYKQEVTVCIEFLSQQKTTKKINKKLNSYHIKHYIEEWHEKAYGYHRYISNDAVIEAFTRIGIPYEMHGVNANGAIKLIKEKKIVDCTYISIS